MADKPQLNLICGGAGARPATQVGAFRVLRERFDIQKIHVLSVGAITGSMLAADTDQEKLEGLMTQLDMHGLMRSTERFRNGGIFSLDGPTEALRQALEDEGVRTFGDLRPLDPGYASRLRPGDRWRLNVRVWALPGDAWLAPSIARIAWADRFHGEAHRERGEAQPRGVFGAMRTRHLPEEADGPVEPASLPVAAVAALTMAAPASFPPGRYPDALQERTYDGAMLERVPVRCFPQPLRERRDGGNDLYRLADGAPDRTPVIALAMDQPNRLTREQQAAWDHAHKTRKHGVAVIRLPHCDVGVTAFKEAQRRSAELIEAGAAATEIALASRELQQYLAQQC
jgi:predicted acylesterase/phospholipase RssA